MVGASGAIAGVLGAYLLLYPRANVYCFIWIVIIFRIVSVPAWVLLGLWFAMQLFSGLGAAAGKPGVAFWAHVGGFAAGLVLVTVLRPPGVGLLRQPRSPIFTATRLGGGGRGSVPSAGRRYRPPPGPWS
jgi:membrane associated rhomboid family serine protease